MYFLLKKHSHTRTHTERLSQHFVRGKSFVSMSKIHLCGRWQLVNKRTFDSSGCFGRAGSQFPFTPLIVPLLASSSFHHLAQMQPSAKATWQHRSLEFHLPSLLLLLLLFTGISVSFRFVTRHTHTHAHTRRNTHWSTRAAHTLSMWARTMCSHWAQMCQIMTCRRVQFIW